MSDQHERAVGKIIWIASYPKSGNTWVRVFFNNLVNEAVDLKSINDARYLAPFENAGYFYQPHFSKPLSEVSDDELAKARPRVHRAIAAMAPGFVFIKTHYLLGNHRGTMTITPDATAAAIYLVRNPLDIAVSYSEFRGREIDATIKLMNLSGRMLPRSKSTSYQLIGSWAENVESWTRTPHERLLIVRYEDLLEDPLTGFKRIVNFLRMNASDEAVERAQKLSSFSVLKEAEELEGFVERPRETKSFFRSGRKDEWKERLTSKQVSEIVDPNYQLMRRFGYWD
jgi:hypothetical protein